MSSPWEQYSQAATQNRYSLARSDEAVCYHCLAHIPAAEVLEFGDEGTALCPRCGIDAVVGDASGIDIDDDNTTAQVHRRAFGDDAESDADSMPSLITDVESEFDTISGIEGLTTEESDWDDSNSEDSENLPYQ
jgi:hypothetical protein